MKAIIELDEWQERVLESKGNIIVCSGRQSGKSFIVSRKASQEALSHDNWNTLVISATERQAHELFVKILTEIPEEELGQEKPTQHIITLKNKSRIFCYPTGRFGVGIRGYTINLLIVDEAAFVSDDVFQVITPMLLTTGGDIWLISTPHGKRGYFWDRYNDPNFTIFHVNTERIINERKISISWTEIQSKKAKEFLEQEKSRMSERQYAQEYLGEFIMELNSFFSNELINKCQKARRRDFIPSKYMLGVDVARMGDDEATLEIVDISNRKNLIHVENIILRKVFLTDISNRILELDKIYNFEKINIDDGGMGVGVFDYLLAQEQTKRKVIAINNKARPLDKDKKNKKKMLKEDLYMNLLGLMERDEIILLQDDEVELSLKSIQYEYVIKKGEISTLRIFGDYSHIVEGIIRAVWLERQNPLWVVSNAKVDTI